MWPRSSEEFKITSDTHSAPTPYHVRRLELAIEDRAGENNILAFVGGELQAFSRPYFNEGFLVR